MERPDFATWLRFAGLPAPPQELADDVRRKCAVYVLKHGGDPGTVWDVALPNGGMLTVYHDWIYDHGRTPEYGVTGERAKANSWAVQIVRMHIGRFENDPETWLFLGMRAWLPLSMIPRSVVDRWGPTGVSGQARVSSLGRETVEFELISHDKATVKLTGRDAVQALRADQILLAPRPDMVAEW